MANVQSTATLAAGPVLNTSGSEPVLNEHLDNGADFPISPLQDAVAPLSTFAADAHADAVAPEAAPQEAEQAHRNGDNGGLDDRTTQSAAAVDTNDEDVFGDAQGGDDDFSGLPATSQSAYIDAASPGAGEDDGFGDFADSAGQPTQDEDDGFGDFADVPQVSEDQDDGFGGFADASTPANTGTDDDVRNPAAQPCLSME